MRRRAGFTLFEILLVVMIIAVMTGISMPLMRSSFQNARLKGAARDVSGFVRLARNTAVLRERPCEIRFDLEKDQYWLVALDENGNEEDQNNRQRKRDHKDLKLGEEFASARTLPKDVHFAVIYSGASVTEDKKLPRVIYYADGSSTPATIVVQDMKKKAFNIEIYQTTGMARVEEGMPVKMPDKSKLYYGPKAKDEE